MKQRLERMNKS